MSEIQARDLTPAQFDRAIQGARRKHDAQFEADNPRPVLDTTAQLTKLERAASYLWVIWTVLALAGAFISMPHTLRTILGTVDLAPALAWAYSFAAFVGVELALLGVALAAELKRSEERAATRPKRRSLAGLVNTVAAAIGVRARVDTSHLPDRPEPTGGALVILLFLTSLVFNLADTLADVTLLAPFAAEVHLVSRVMAGTLGPALLLIAGHRFAVEVVRAASGRLGREARFERELAEWRALRQQSWDRHGGTWTRRELVAEWERRNPSLEGNLNPYLEADEDPFGLMVPTGNGHGGGRTSPAGNHRVR